MSEPRTQAGKRHVDWLVQANIPTFSGELYRSNFQVSATAIEAEAREELLAELRAKVEALPHERHYGYGAEVVDREFVLALLDPEHPERTT